jgi:hypothetical protein
LKRCTARRREFIAVGATATWPFAARNVWQIVCMDVCFLIIAIWTKLLILLVGAAGLEPATR